MSLKTSIRYHDSDIYKLDVISIALSYIISFFLVVRNFDLFLQKNLHVIFLISVCSWLFYSYTVIQNIFLNRRIRYINVIDNFFKIYFLCFVTVLAYAAMFEFNTSKYYIYYSFLIYLVLGISFRILFVHSIRRKRRKGADYKSIAIVGVNEFTKEFAQEISEHPEYGYRVLGFFDYDPLLESKRDNLLLIDQLNTFLLKKQVDEVYVAMPLSNDYHIKGLTRFCHINEIKISFINEFIYSINRKFVQLEIDYHGPTPIVSMKEETLEKRVEIVAKRIFDVVFSSLAIVFVMSWLYPIIGLWIKFNSKGPVLFKQLRSGLNNQPFYCYKFRTMVVNLESDKKQATKGDPRITKSGAFLRKTSLDELPQIFNVFIGNMSIVGPRPHMLQHTKAYAKLIDAFMVRHWIKPGITGLAQAKGFRGETKDLSQMHNRVRMDLLYLKNWSFYLDMKILVNTVIGVLTQKNTGF